MICPKCGDETNASTFFDGEWLCYGCEMASRNVSNDEKPTNPKDALGADKIPYSLFPSIATAHGCLALLDGASKYGRSNWRMIGVRASIYIDACRRHLDAWFEGEDSAPDSGVHHLGHALACIAIILDAQAAGKLNDDRLVKGGYVEEFKKLTEQVKQIKANHADKSPKHYTIQDSEQPKNPKIGAEPRREEKDLEPYRIK